MTDVSSRRRVRAHRERLRAQGLRPVQIWVPDVTAEGFAAEAHRQSRAVAESAARLSRVSYTVGNPATAGQPGRMFMHYPCCTGCAHLPRWTRWPRARQASIEPCRRGGKQRSSTGFRIFPSAQAARILSVGCSMPTVGETRPRSRTTKLLPILSTCTWKPQSAGSAASTCDA